MEDDVEEVDDDDPWQYNLRDEAGPKKTPPNNVKRKRQVISSDEEPTPKPKRNAARTGKTYNLPKSPIEVVELSSD